MNKEFIRGELQAIRNEVSKQLRKKHIVNIMLSYEIVGSRDYDKLFVELQNLIFFVSKLEMTEKKLLDKLQTF